MQVAFNSPTSSSVWRAYVTSRKYEQVRYLPKNIQQISLPKLLLIHKDEKCTYALVQVDEFTRVWRCRGEGYLPMEIPGEAFLTMVDFIKCALLTRREDSYY